MREIIASWSNEIVPEKKKERHEKDKRMREERMSKSIL